MAQPQSNRLAKKTRSIETQQKKDGKVGESPPITEKKLISQSIEYSSGPLPHPSILEGYNNIISGGAERIMAMAEKQLDHRIETESFVARETMSQRKRGQNYALVVSIFALSVSAILGVSGHETAATIIAGSQITALAAAFIVEKTIPSREKPNPDEKPSE
ncbi:MAG: DUF2335 domain-containing protein [Chlorobiaceae bacterium]|nr:DUF2335 domain-containing protein [Chlorobiaceae bacterium]